MATTLTEGDPTWAGALAGVRLELLVFHITEESVKAAVPPDVYAAQVGLAEVALDTAAIGETVQQVRSRLTPSD